jgi:hypothetical protein
MTAQIRSRFLLPGAVVALALAACAPRERAMPTIRTYSESFAFRITSDPMPPRARETILYKIVVLDKETGQPVEGGEGRIFANNKEGTSTWDSFQRGREVGTYYAKLRFVTAEQWAVGIEFRRDSLPTTRIERATDYQQEVGSAVEP